MIETIKTNFKHEYEPNLTCNSCKISECNQSHLIYCNALIGSNQVVTYIPTYEDIFNDDEIEEQNFIAERRYCIWKGSPLSGWFFTPLP